MNSKKIAVVILNWNGIQFLKDYLPSVVNCSNSNISDVIVADNGSTDASVTFLKSTFPTVNVIQLDKNYGFAEGYNQAIKQLDYEYVLLLNSDVKVTEGWLEPLLQRLEQNPSIAACTPKLRAVNEPEKFEYAGAAGGFIDILGYAFCRGRIFDSVEVDEGQYDDACRVFWGTGAALLVKTSIFNKAGGLDGRFFAHMEEIDLCWRFWRMGFEVWYEPQSTVYHFGGGTLSQGNPHKTYLNYRNSLMMLLKNLRKRELIWILPLRMILDGVSAAKYLLANNFGDFWAVFKAHVSFYSLIPYTIAFRRRIKTVKFKTSSISYKGSIVWQYFAKGKKKYSDLK